MRSWATSLQVKDAWFGGGYLNIRLGLEYNPSSNTPHLVNVVYDDVKSTADTVFLTLRHNAFADTVRTRMGTATASFNMERWRRERMRKPKRRMMTETM